MLIGLLPGPVAGSIISPAVAAVLAQPASVELGLLHGLTLQLLLSGLTFVFGVSAYFKRNVLRRSVAWLDFGTKWGAARVYEVALGGMKTLAFLQTRLLQSGHLHYYLLILVLTTVGMVGFSMKDFWHFKGWEAWSEIRFYEYIAAGVIMAATIMAVRTRSRLAAVVALGVVGYSMVLIYIMFGAPDLAMTQFSIDTLTVILLVLVLYRLPRYVDYSTTLERVRDAVPAVAAGAVITLLTLAATAGPVDRSLSSYFSANSYLLAKGRNIVNVILVDFRAMDTMGEITVLAVAALGVYSLLKLGMGKNGGG
jgi:multicomponent Na+:H+ antiporter subunit A